MQTPALSHVLPTDQRRIDYSLSHTTVRASSLSHLYHSTRLLCTSLVILNRNNPKQTQITQDFCRRLRTPCILMDVTFLLGLPWSVKGEGTAGVSGLYSTMNLTCTMKALTERGGRAKVGAEGEDRHVWASWCELFISQSAKITGRIRID